MTFALATALFLAIGWFAVQAIAATLDGKTSRIMSALRGDVPAQAIPVSVRVSQRYAPRPARPARAHAPWRAAA